MNSFYGRFGMKPRSEYQDFLSFAEIVSAYTSDFWNNVFKPLHQNNKTHLMLMAKVHFTNSELGHRSLAVRVNFSDKTLFIEYLISSLGLLNESYKVNVVNKITFSYIIKEGIASEDRMLLQDPTYKVTKHNFNNISLPLSMNPADYGEIRGTFNIEGGIRYFVKNNNTSFEIDVCGNINTVTIVNSRNLTWIDTAIKDSTFERVINKNTLYIKDGAIIVKTKQLNAKPFKNVDVDKKLSDATNIMTIDIETTNIDGILKPYLICGYNPKGKSSIASFAENVTDEGIDNMFNNFINTLISLKHITEVYAHNLSSFDGVFLLKHLIKIFVES
jgi:hypothetical protein